MENNKKILLVDDMDIFNFIMKKLIKNVNPYHQVYDFTNGNHALAHLDELNPNVIFLDLNMPEINGWEFLETMQSKKSLHKVYILTSSTSEVDRQRSTTYQNVVNFLVKPVNQDKLAEILQTV